MTLNVLIVDDSSFFQGRLKQIINEHPELKVVGVANNGREAIEKVKNLKPDVITMDYEMPMMDGVTAVRTIMAENPTPILMLSSMTYEGARITLDALDAGAVDFMTKNFSEISKNSPEIKNRIYEALLTIGGEALGKKQSTDIQLNKSSGSNSNLKSFVINQPQKKPKSIVRDSSFKPKIIVIGASTGGPQAVTDLLKQIPGNFPIPILIVQHMPETFTSAFAERLNRQCHISVKEASMGDEIKAGLALIAPGGKQLIVDKSNQRCVKVIDASKPVKYTPCVDISFASVCNTYGADTLAIVLTGMGSDGCDGARLLKGVGAKVWTQNEESSLIYGMPKAIEQANLSDASLDLMHMQKEMLKLR